MKRLELIELLEKAASATSSYAGAIDGHLYRVSSYYAQQEQAMRDLSDALDQAITIIRDGQLEG